MQRCVIIDYGSGNLRSAAKAFERAALEREIEIDILVSGDPGLIRRADRLVLPGVGAFADCRRGLDAAPGLVEALNRRVAEGAPFLGICVGMQLMAERGLEFETTRGLAWLAGDVVAIRPGETTPRLKVPHMGWNDLTIRRDSHPLLAGIAPGADVYFVHSFHFACARRDDILATVEYGDELAAIVGRHNLAGTQFHPEKSQSTGLRLIANFLGWRP